MRGQAKVPKLIEFKGTSLPVVTATLRSTDVAALQAALQKMLGNAPDFFSGEPAVLDFIDPPSSDQKVDWRGLIALLKRYQLQPVAVRHAGAAETSALSAGLFVAPPQDQRGRPMPQPVPEPEPQAPEPAPVAPAAASAPDQSQIQAAVQAAAAKPETVIVDRPLRSGQRVHARGDLIVLDLVSAGAEAIADGNVHVYAPLRGRALAGARGDHSARIFTTCMAAELVSIAGVYQTFEQGLPKDIGGKPTQICLSRTTEGEKLLMRALKIA